MILIIKNGYNEIQLTKYLDEEANIISSFDMLELEHNKKNLHIYSIIIILGGHQSMTELSQHQNLLSVIDFIKICIEYQKPILGICLGSQILAHIYGSEIKTLEKLNCGYDTNVLDFTNIFRCHIDYIIPNDQMEVIDTFESMPYIFKIKGANIYGIQCHPDIGPEYIARAYDDQKIKAFAFENELVINFNNKRFMDYLLEKLRNN